MKLGKTITVSRVSYALKLSLSCALSLEMFHAQLFVNVYIVANKKDSIDVGVIITQQNFRYAISQFIIGKRISNRPCISSIPFGF